MKIPIWKTWENIKDIIRMNNNSNNNSYSNKNRGSNNNNGNNNNNNNGNNNNNNNEEENILWAAIQAQDNDLIREIVEEQPELLNEPLWYGHTPLIEAARGFRGIVNGAIVSDDKRYNEQAMLLVELGANVNQTSDLGWTALFQASAGDNVPLVKFLLDHGADPNIEDEAGDSPLTRALVRGNMEVIEMLVRKGARITPLILQHAHTEPEPEPEPFNNEEEPWVPEEQMFTPQIKELIDYIYGLQQSMRNERDWALAFGKRGISGFMANKGIPENVEKIIKSYAKRGGFRKTKKRKSKKSKKSKKTRSN
jgi:ankyrin repeat protein